MAIQRNIEVFSAGCPTCEEAVQRIQRIACPSCDVHVLDMSDPGTAERAQGLGIERLPAVVVNGRLAGCCTGGGLNEETLRAEGIGEPLA